MLLKIEEEKNKELQQKTSQLQTEQGREKILREKFQIKKPGETVAIILNPESPKSALEKQNNRNAWNKILNWWFGKQKLDIENQKLEKRDQFSGKTFASQAGDASSILVSRIDKKREDERWVYTKDLFF